MEAELGSFFKKILSMPDGERRPGLVPMPNGASRRRGLFRWRASGSAVGVSPTARTEAKKKGEGRTRARAELGTIREKFVGDAGLVTRAQGRTTQLEERHDFFSQHLGADGKRPSGPWPI